MANPDSITVETIELIDSVVVSPLPTIDAIDVNTVDEVTNINVGFNESLTEISISDDPATLDVSISIADYAPPVLSVNGKTGNVVIDYPDISSTPVNHVRYVHTQASIPTVETSGKWSGYYVWTVNHNLNFFPSVTVFDSGDNLIEAYIDYTNINTAIIVMNSAISGTAYLS